MTRTLILAILLLLTLTSCKGAGVAGECASTSSIQCLTERKCSYDTGRNCMVCQCADGALMLHPFNKDGRLPAPNEER
jgi:hypothetical protein